MVDFFCPRTFVNGSDKKLEKIGVWMGQTTDDRHTTDIATYELNRHRPSQLKPLLYVKLSLGSNMRTYFMSIGHCFIHRPLFFSILSNT